MRILQSMSLHDLNVYSPYDQRVLVVEVLGGKDISPKYVEHTRRLLMDEPETETRSS